MNVNGNDGNNNPTTDEQSVPQNIRIACEKIGNLQIKSSPRTRIINIEDEEDSRKESERKVNNNFGPEGTKRVNNVGDREETDFKHERRERRRRVRGPRNHNKPPPESGPKNVSMKNAVMMLNEMFPPPSAPQYKVLSMTGTPNNPTFEMACIIMDQSFVGTGRSKKDAKLEASQVALKQLFGKDFSTNEAKSETSIEENAQLSVAVNNLNCQEIDSWMELEGKNPVSILNELYPGVIFSLVSSQGPSHAPEFCVTASLAGLTFEGRGNSKKEAKLHASKALLVHIHQVGFDPMTGGLRSKETIKIESQGHSWADKIGSLVRGEYSRIFDSTTYHKRKVMAGIVVDVSGDSKVICLSSGTKCINGELISLGGLSLNDCHAEVIVRRCLVSWFYSQLETVLKGEKEQSVLEKDDEGGFRVRAGVSFHLFISTAPCGDARIFSLHEQPTKGTNVLSGYAGRMGEGNRGKLRSKIESGMGTVPLPEHERVQTWDGVMSGERLLTMACSDKILSWNVIGLQGSLLSHWLRPIYFSSITIGSKFHPDHVTRALYGRLTAPGDINSKMKLPKHYRLNQPPLLATTSPESRQPSKAQEHSVNWVQGFQPEVITCSTGRTSQGGISRLCKQSFAVNFIRLCSLPGALSRSKMSLNSLSLDVISRCSYADIKLLAVDNMAAKNTLMKRLHSLGCGRWVVKPIEQDQFSLSLIQKIQTKENSSSDADKVYKHKPYWRGSTIATIISVFIKLLLWNFPKLVFAVIPERQFIVKKYLKPDLISTLILFLCVLSTFLNSSEFVHYFHEVSRN